MRLRSSVAGLLVVVAPAVAAQGHEMHMSGAAGWHAGLEGTAFLQYVRSFGTRGAYQFGSVNHAVFAASGPGLGGTVGVHVMGSLDQLTLPERGVPQPLQVAFTSDGTTITDHAHPSPWIMELAARYERPLVAGISGSVYAGAIGAPALGPTIYLHRESAAANPAEPLGHHAQDITHSSFGVVTFGLSKGRVRLEGSAFNDRQPSEPSAVFFYRGARLDSYAVRATIGSVAWSYGYLPPAGGSHNHGAIHRLAVTAVHDGGPWHATFVYAADDPIGGGGPRHSVLAEGERRFSGGHALFARAEFVQRSAEELSLVGSVSELQDLASLQLGYARAMRRRRGVELRLGAYTTVTHIPPQLEPFYGSGIPFSAAAFAQVAR